MTLNLKMNISAIPLVGKNLKKMNTGCRKTLASSVEDSTARTEQVWEQRKYPLVERWKGHVIGTKYYMHTCIFTCMYEGTSESLWKRKIR